MNMREKSFAKSIAETLSARHQAEKWESFIGQMLHKLELSPEEFNRAKKKYEQLAEQVARKLGIADTDVHVVVQGSMQTQTAIRPRKDANFDLDIVVKLSGSKYDGNTDPEKFFADFGEALDGINDTAGAPKAKRRCWRLQYPGEPFYFDVTPAIPGSEKITGTVLRVRDPDTRWNPSNPEEFADWFCELEAMKFRFETQLLKTIQASDEARKQIEEIPSDPVGLDDIPRRFIQLIKLHRDLYYYGLSDQRKEAKPISVILVTLAGHAYRDLYAQQQVFSSPIEVILELVDRLPRYIDESAGQYRVMNPALPRGAIGENFADRWNSDGGARAKEFDVWHKQLVKDLALLLEEDYEHRSEGRIRGVFGQAGVDAWKNSQPKPGVLGGLLNSAPNSKGNPTSATRTGSKNTLA